MARRYAADGRMAIVMFDGIDGDSKMARYYGRVVEKGNVTLRFPHFLVDLPPNASIKWPNSPEAFDAAAKKLLGVSQVQREGAWKRSRRG